MVIGDMFLGSKGNLFVYDFKVGGSKIISLW